MVLSGDKGPGIDAHYCRPVSFQIQFHGVSGNKPDIDLTISPAKCHLTSGWEAIIVANVSGSDLPLGGTDFGFIQFSKQSILEIEYSGSKRMLGGVELSPAKRPAWAAAATTLLDSSGKDRPWTIPPPRFKLVNNQVSCRTGDSPELSVGFKMQNRKTSADNFLRSVKDKREFWTVFTKKVRHQTPSNEYLAHFHWSLIYSFELIWRHGSPLTSANHSKFQFDRNLVDGPPTDPDVGILLNEANQGGPDINEVGDFAMKASVNGELPNRRDEPEWFPSTPPDFFK